MSSFQPKACSTITSPAETKAWLHPERQRIVAMLVSQARTISSVAAEMDVHPANITHHFRKLETAGLIKLVETRDTGRNIEKYYRAIALMFEVRPKRGAVDSANTTVLGFLRDDLTSAIHGAAADDLRAAYGLIANIKLAPADFSRFTSRLDALLKEYIAAESEDGEAYSMNLSLYPNDTARPPQRIEIRKQQKKGNR
jgi:DNA-binding transcriptional ArsR family regulator